MSHSILKASTATAVVLLLSSFAFGVSAQEKKVTKAPACNAIKTEAACTSRDDCAWVAALMDKDGKQLRRAYCRAKPAPAKEPAAKKEPGKK